MMHSWNKKEVLCINCIVARQDIALLALRKPDQEQSTHLRRFMICFGVSSHYTLTIEIVHRNVTHT